MSRVLILFIGLLTATPSPGQPIAFPGAVGQGAAATGGRGGDVYHVTTLQDYDTRQDEQKIKGSLRHAIRSATGPRTIVFDVSGLIRLRGPLEILKSELTVAGQTSPGGITLYGYPLEFSGCTDVVVRYIRVRTGDSQVRPASGNGLDPGSANAVNVGPACDRIMLDHLSASWGIDETLSVTRCRNVTVQHCLIAESLNESLHPKGAHGYGSLIRGEVSADDQQRGRGGYTFFGNLWAHHRARNPSIGGEQSLGRGFSRGERGRADVNLINNVIYNWGDAPTHRSQGGQVRLNLVGNYYVNGPESSSDYIFREGDSGKTELYHEGNFHDADRDVVHNGTLVGQLSAEAFRRFDDLDRLLGSPTDRAFPFINSVAMKAVSAEESYAWVVQSVGASLWRDAIDQRVIESLERRTGSIINSQESLRGRDGQLSGIDDLPCVEREDSFDTDGDGLPDEFEERHGLDPLDPADGNTVVLSEQGYTNLEVYLNQLTIRESE